MVLCRKRHSSVDRINLSVYRSKGVGVFIKPRFGWAERLRGKLAGAEATVNFTQQSQTHQNSQIVCFIAARAAMGSHWPP
jgi:hypothetical protein